MNGLDWAEALGTVWRRHDPKSLNSSFHRAPETACPFTRSPAERTFNTLMAQPVGHRKDCSYCQIASSKKQSPKSVPTINIGSFSIKYKGMKQNVYNNKIFFQKYSQMRRSVKGLEGAGEWETVKKMLPNFKDKRILDLGCGFGWHCQYALEQGAASVIGVDSSEKMLNVARKKTSKEIKYRCESIEDLKFPKGSFDVVISSLAFHYLKSFEDVVKNVFSWLVDGGEFVFSIEHPIFTSYGTQDWFRDNKGHILHFPVDNYFYEGKRESNFIGEKVIKYHKTLTTYINTLIQNGFGIIGAVEPQPSENMLKTIESMKDELRRPMMLIISAKKMHNSPEWRENRARKK